MNGRPLTLTWEAEHCGAILETWFGGTEAGNAVADVLFGDYNPSGKLTATFPRSVGQIPIYYNHKNTGRPYKGDPGISNMFPVTSTCRTTRCIAFGYGLSYTTFSYGEVKLSKTRLTGDETLLASVNVTNTGERAGEETVQLVSQPAGGQRDAQRGGFAGIPESPPATGRNQAGDVPHHAGRFEILQLANWNMTGNRANSSSASAAVQASSSRRLCAGTGRQFQLRPTERAIHL